MGQCVCYPSNIFFPLLQNVEITCPPGKNSQGTKLEIMILDETTSQLRSTQQSLEIGFSIVSEVESIMSIQRQELKWIEKLSSQLEEKLRRLNLMGVRQLEVLEPQGLLQQELRALFKAFGKAIMMLDTKTSKSQLKLRKIHFGWNPEQFKWFGQQYKEEFKALAVLVRS